MIKKRRRPWSMILFPLVILLLGSSAFSDQRKDLNYSGETQWDPTTGNLVFVSSGHMPDTQEGFYWNVPSDVKRIFIRVGVRVTGGFRILPRDNGNVLRIEGEDRKTSVIYGTDEQKWTVNRGISENEKWKYGALNVLGDATVYVMNLTSQNPRSYNLSGYTKQAVIHVSDCNLLDTRPGSQNNSNGLVAAAGSSIRNSFISTSDDSIVIRRDMTVENVTIEQHRNGAPIQLGWSDDREDARAMISTLVIQGTDPEHRYLMAPISWEHGTAGSRTILIKGLKVETEGSIYLPTEKRFVPIGLLKIQAPGGEFNFTATDAEISPARWGIRRAQGEVSVAGTKMHD